MPPIERIAQQTTQYTYLDQRVCFFQISPPRDLQIFLVLEFDIKIIPLTRDHQLP